jgi:predicted nucleic acid-binding protein
MPEPPRPPKTPAQDYQRLYDEWLAVQQIARSVSVSNDVLISAAVWFELQAFVFADGKSLAEKIASHMPAPVVIEQIDVRVVELGGVLLRKMRANPKLCLRCLSVDADKPCKKCGRLGSRLHKTTDALIVAHAELIERVTTLYTLDDGPIDFSRGLASTHLTVMKPGNPHGVLFGATGSTASSSTPTRPRKKS